MELPYSSQGIVLTSDKYRESDRLLAIYTHEHGKIKVISRGSRKMSSKLSPHLEPLDYVSLMLVNGKVLITLTGSSKIENFKNLKASGAYTLLALHLLELVSQSVPENLPDKKIYNLLLDLLRYLDKNGEKLRKMSVTCHPELGSGSNKSENSLEVEMLNPPAGGQHDKEKKLGGFQTLFKSKLTIQEIIIAFKLKLLEFLGLRPEEIAEMPEVLKILETDFAPPARLDLPEAKRAGGLESIDWKKIPKSKLEKILDYAFFDVLGKPMIGFEKYIHPVKSAL